VTGQERRHPGEGRQHAADREPRGDGELLERQSGAPGRHRLLLAVVSPRWRCGGGSLADSTDRPSPDGTVRTARRSQAVRSAYDTGLSASSTPSAT
jgi:hypothetical protein